MRVFVLGTGRCGTTTFIRACEHFDNYTAGHETLARQIASERLAYPDQHIEADNRLSWMLGSLAQRFDGSNVFYVHLRRDRDEVINSFVERWGADHRTNIIRAFAHGIIMRPSDWTEVDIPRVCGFYVDVVTANIDEFLRNRPGMVVWLHELPETFVDVMSAVGATGDHEGSLHELTVRHNAARPTPGTD